jgi:hypothetical protein
MYSILDTSSGLKASCVQVFQTVSFFHVTCSASDLVSMVRIGWKNFDAFVPWLLQ